MRDANRVAAFAALVFALSLPFWVLGALSQALMMPGLPVSALAVLAPAVAAVAQTWLADGVGATQTLLMRAADAGRTNLRTLVIAIAVMPALTIVTWFAMRANGVAMPEVKIEWPIIATLFAIFLVAAMLEELGWSGYLAEPAQRLWGFLGAGVLIGAIWAVWHLPALLQAGRGADWIAWWILGTISTRIITLAIYERAQRSVFAAALLHAAQNTAWQTFPIGGSHFDPSYAAPVFALGAAAITLRRVTKFQRQ
jgi:uncharacterized protein